MFVKKKHSTLHPSPYHKTSIFQTCRVSQRPKVPCCCQCCGRICLVKKNKCQQKSQEMNHEIIRIAEKVHQTCMYMSSMVPPFPVGTILNTSTHRQSRYHDCRSLRISATWQKQSQPLFRKNKVHFFNSEPKEHDGYSNTPSWVLDSQGRRLVLPHHYSCGKQQRFQSNPDQAAQYKSQRIIRHKNINMSEQILLKQVVIFC